MLLLHEPRFDVACEARSREFERVRVAEESFGYNATDDD